ncbi:uncharacterized protein EV420DRAFT_1501449 [Desarmillaria tabescens]|uniref:Uncharacterized protein n=1 Tax=Armillaria tabescens TaxID=1929756 RepID=A0AA39TRD8_ARMTA|nr:uncharacterized protein EV420DRAFT_1501449 [Desarmillaria tabescens]KAK0467817.1 hypothetical protein EV420DRAFT_1501449 [Desarmillaria tabescens]
MSPKNAIQIALFSFNAVTSWASCLAFSMMNRIHSFIMNMFTSTINWFIMVAISALSIVSHSKYWRNPMDVLGNLILDALSTFLTMAGVYQFLKEMLVAVLSFEVWVMRDNIRGHMYAIKAIGNAPSLPQPLQMCIEGYRSSQADILNSLEILESFIITPSIRVRDLAEVNQVLQAYKERLTHLQNSYKAICQGLAFTGIEDERMTMADKWVGALRSWEPPSLPATLTGKEEEIAA